MRLDDLRASLFRASLPPAPGLTASSYTYGREFATRFFQLRLTATPCVSLRLPSSAPIGSFHPTRFCPCWAHSARVPLDPLVVRITEPDSCASTKVAVRVADWTLVEGVSQDNADRRPVPDPTPAFQTLCRGLPSCGWRPSHYEASKRDLVRTRVVMERRLLPPRRSG